MKEDDKLLFGFLLEAYAYMVLVNSFCPPGELNRSIPYDSFLSDLSTLAVYPSFGVMFDGMHGLMEIIPEITKLAIRKLKQRTWGSSQPDEEASSTRQDIYTKISRWQVSHDEGSSQDVKGVAETTAIGECFRNALFLYLETSAAGPIVWDPALAGTMQHHILAIAGQIATAGLQESRYTAIIMWPLLIAGSCLVLDELRDQLVRVLRDSTNSTWNSARATDLLEMLWEERERDERIFGPYGLYLTMEKRGVNFCIA
jgi:hypothetical protein